MRDRNTIKLIKSARSTTTYYSRKCVENWSDIKKQI